MIKHHESRPGSGKIQLGVYTGELEKENHRDYDRDWTHFGRLRKTRRYTTI